jgi:Spy/CpxP family protein refolding chaperone
MVQSESVPLSGSNGGRNGRRYAALGAAAGVVAVCAVVVMATHTADTNLVAKPNVWTPALSRMRLRC